MQHTVQKPAGTRPIAIEVDGKPLGVVVPAPEGFRFLAVRFNAFGIDGQTFASVEAAQRAASRALDQAAAQ